MTLINILLKIAKKYFMINKQIKLYDNMIKIFFNSLKTIQEAKSEISGELWNKE